MTDTVSQNSATRIRSVAPARSGIRQTFAALHHRNYRLWFIGQFVSLFGTWMQSSAEGFLMYQLTRSPAYLGYVGFAAGLPSWIFMLYGGVVSDRMPRRRLLVITQATMMVLAATLATLTFTGLVRPWHILVLAAGLGLANAFDAPARQAFVSELVEREDLTNAIAMNAMMFNAAMAVGPATAGLAYQVFGPAWCFTLNALSFVAVIAALQSMRLRELPASAPWTSARQQLTEALGYVLSQPTVRALMAIVGLSSGFAFSLVTVLPAWSVNILHGDARTNGLLQSARGVGAVVAAFVIASLGGGGYRGRLLTAGTFAMPVFMALFDRAQTVPEALLALAALGSAMILVANLANGLIQAQVPDRLRGRVMSMYTLTMFGMLPIGSLVIGGLAEFFGERAAVLSCAGILLSVASAMWVLAPQMRTLE